MVKFVVKLNIFWIGTNIGMVVDIDPLIMIVVCGSFVFNVVSEETGAGLHSP